MNLDVSAGLDGFCSDTGISVAVGRVPRLARALVDLSALSDDNQRTTLRERLVLAIEPFLSASADRAADSDDGWTLRTEDDSLVA